MYVGDTPLSALLQPLLDIMQLPAKKLVVNRKDILRSELLWIKEAYRQPVP